MHKVLEDLFERARHRAVTWAWLRDRFEERLFASYRFLLTSDAADFRARGLRILERFWREHRPAVGHDDLLEKRFRAPIGGFDVSGVIDRIERRTDGIRIIDYKSGRAGPGGPDFRQLNIYALAATRALGQEPDRVAYHFLGDNSVHEQTPAASELADAEDWTRTLGAGIARSEFSPRTGRHCPRCDYFRHCRPGQRWARDNARR